MSFCLDATSTLFPLATGERGLISTYGGWRFRRYGWPRVTCRANIRSEAAPRLHTQEQVHRFLLHSFLLEHAHFSILSGYHWSKLSTYPNLGQRGYHCFSVKARGPEINKREKKKKATARQQSRRRPQRISILPCPVYCQVYTASPPPRVCWWECGRAGKKQTPPHAEKHGRRKLLEQERRPLQAV